MIGKFRLKKRNYNQTEIDIIDDNDNDKSKTIKKLNLLFYNYHTKFPNIISIYTSLNPTFFSK